MYCSKCGKEVKAEEKFCGNCGQKINIGINQKLEENITNDRKGNILGIIVTCIILTISIFYFGGSINDSPSNEEEYVETAVQYLSNYDLGMPIKEFIYYDSNIIYYGEDVLIRLSFIEGSLTSNSSNGSSVTYSVNRGTFVSQNELEMMMYEEDWKNAKVSDISPAYLKDLYNKYFK